MGKAGSGPCKPVAGKLHHPRPRLGHTLRLTAGISKARHRWLGIECGRHTQDHTRHHAWRRKRVVRSPAHEAQHVAPHRRAVENFGNLPQFSGVNGIGLALADDPRHLTRTERHAHDRSGLDVHPFRNHIRIRPLCGHGHEHGNDPWCELRKQTRNGVCNIVRIFRHDRVTLARLCAKEKPPSGT